MPPPSKQSRAARCNAPRCRADVGRIIEAYRRAGRSEVRVDPQIIDRGNGRVDLVYAITEGQKPRCGRSTSPATRLSANGSSRRDQDLRHHMLSFLTGGDVYDPDRVAQDQEQLRLYYRSKGYADVNVSSAKAEYDPALKGFTLSFQSMKARSIASGRSASPATSGPGLRKASRPPTAHPGAVFDGNALDKTTELLAIEMAKLGYPFAQATPRLTRDAAAQAYRRRLRDRTGGPRPMSNGSRSMATPAPAIT